MAVAARYVRAWLESLCGSLLAWESAAGPCHTIISKAELTGRAAPSDLLGAPFNYITMAVMATVSCRPPGASQRFRAVLVRLRAARASGRLCAAGRGPRQRGPRALSFRTRSQVWVSLCLYRGTRSHADIPRAWQILDVYVTREITSGFSALWAHSIRLVPPSLKSWRAEDTTSRNWESRPQAMMPPMNWANARGQDAQ